MEGGSGAGEASGGGEGGGRRWLTLKIRSSKMPGELPQVGVAFAVGLAVSFGAAGVCRALPMLVPGTSHHLCVLDQGRGWEMGVFGMRTRELVRCLPSACRHLSFRVLTPPLHPGLKANASAPSLLPAAALRSLLKQLKKHLGGWEKQPRGH